MGDGGSRDLFRYLVAEEADDYTAVMDCFSDLLLAELSAADITSVLASKGTPLHADVVEARCRRLVHWGNLATSGRDPSGNAVADFVRARARYRTTVSGARVHREAAVLASSRDGAREVARESLGCIADALALIDDLVGESGAVADPDALAGHVTGLFAHHRNFTDSVADFYTYLGGVLARLDLSDDEYTEFKLLLLEYLDVVTSDVAKHAPVVATRLGDLMPRLDLVLAALPATGLPDTAGVVRSPGRSRSDWDELAEWFDEDSGPRRLRDAAAHALSRLLIHTRRLTSATPGFSHRADLLRLAGWFAESSDEQAHRLFAATFGAYPSRHLLLGPDEPDPRVGPGTSWWEADPVQIPVSLRERGDRSPRGRTARIPDPAPDRSRADALAARESRERAEAVHELCTAGDLNGAHISDLARDLLLDALGALLARYRSVDGTVHVDDHDLGFSLTAEPGTDTVVHSPSGDLTVHSLSLRASESGGTRAHTDSDSQRTGMP
ncbi:TIGR02677 family protein [Rhodococcus coprophilus]|uniref:Protein of uncharacterized function (DUF2397) n=1 Tax=Rhodococcus coprophilus TaxID=38310 RepID=A0A2X4U5W4_9NOCA|nr:TIGR02677 family protein [Rhodococcus coprophilus]MBM7457461.1 uncharacterized protein (TIGR02677 family) [Rhodococcus coprophilus]SQI29762.1 Protein of uncharacterised function (DUF2397) [Rhodococcus coprophilus]